MKRFFKFFIAIIINILFFSCEKATLNKEPQNAFSGQDVWSDINLAKSFLNTVYDGIGQWGMHHYRDPQVMTNSATDECMQRGNHGIWVFNKGNITASNYGDFNIWTPDYKAIRKCNIFIQNVNDVPDVSDDNLKRLKAQARFIRAKNYADLLNWYCWWEGPGNGVPIITKPFDLDDDFSDVTRADYTEVVDFIVNELDEIKDYLPEKWDDADFGRVTKGACLALKSEILLYAASKLHNPDMDLSKWKAAADAAKDVMDLNIYSLPSVDDWEDYSNLFLDYSNPEIILARPYDPTNLPSNWVDLFNTPNGYGGWGGNCPTQQFVDKFQMNNGKSPVSSYKNNDFTDPIFNTSSGFDPQHPYENRELRFYADIVYNGRMYRGRKVESWEGGLDSKDGPTGWNVAPTNYTLYKFMDVSKDFQQEAAETPFIIYRLAEIYLNYAEAEYHLGHEGIARTYVNKIRTRAHLPEVQSSGKQLLDDIKHERTIELAFEGDFRWNDLRRWKMVDSTASQDYIKVEIHKNNNETMNYSREVAMPRDFHERMYSLPIPLEELQKAPQLEQNPGY